MNLDPITRCFVNYLEKKDGPPIYKLPIPEARNVLDELQSNIRQVTLFTIFGPVKVHAVYPLGCPSNIYPVIIYFHGGGWILGNFKSHQRLVQELANRSRALLIFVDYPLAPEAKWPTQIEQGYGVLNYIAHHGAKLGADSTRIVLMGDSVGGNMATVVELMASTPILAQVLLYPVTDASFNTKSYEEFKDGPWLTRNSMKWFWGAYLPDSDMLELDNPFISPLRAPLKMLETLPKTLIITNENDVLRDEGEAYGKKLAEAGVPVIATRYLGNIHDFLMLNALANTVQTNHAINQIVEFLCEVFLI
jgi:acetyl esterase